MGTNTSPSYANTFMAKFEDFVYTYHTQPLLWKETLMIAFSFWTRTEGSLNVFLIYMNSCNPNPNILVWEVITICTLPGHHSVLQIHQVQNWPLQSHWLVLTQWPALYLNSRNWTNARRAFLQPIAQREDLQHSLRLWQTHETHDLTLPRQKVSQKHFTGCSHPS